MRRYRDYDPFAWLFTQYWGEDFHNQVLPILERVLLSQLRPKAPILDLCCGDGRVTALLAKRGYQMMGIDGSEQMLSYAKQRLPNVEFLLKDARDFRLEPRFDGVISTFDSLNHVMDSAGLALVFRNVFQCLNPGGLFVFDLNREHAYREFWARNSTSVDPKAVSVARGSYDEVSKVADCDVTLFRLENHTWVRSDFRLSQRFHAEQDVTCLLQKAGFSVQVMDAKRDLDMQGDIGEGRDFYVARKPA